MAMKEKTVYGKESVDPKLLEQIERATETFSSRLSWRRKRQISLAIYHTLREIVPDELARRIATAMTGVAPEPWLAVSEAITSLRKLGVKIYDRKLRRLHRRAIKSPTGELTVAMNARGQWDSPDSKVLNDPIAQIDIRVAGAVHFQVSKYKLEATT